MGFAIFSVFANVALGGFSEAVDCFSQPIEFLIVVEDDNMRSVFCGALRVADSGFLVEFAVFVLANYGIGLIQVRPIWNKAN